jgi:GNAT superfamily N-acetyltransferase
MHDADGIYPANTEEERAAVFKLRYEVYVDELGRYRDIADHEERMLIEDIDEHSRLFYAVLDGKPVAGMRQTWGGDAPFTQRHIDQYQLQPFLERTDASNIIVGERLHVQPQYRGTDILFRMFTTALTFVKENDVELIFGDCEPHLLNLYMSLGFRTYSKRNFNSPAAGYLILLMMLPKDAAYLRAIGSPFAPLLEDIGSTSAQEEWQDILASGSAVSQQLTAPKDYWSQVYGALSELEHNTVHPFDGLTDEQSATCIDKSTVIECIKGDRILKRGNTARNMFIVLSGVLEVKDLDESIIAVFTAGDVFGEMAFLLGTPRTQDVIAATDDVRLLSLSESQIRGITKERSDIAATLMLNISKMLCMRLLRD